MPKKNLLSMPEYPKNHMSDGNVYLVNTRSNGILFCTTDTAWNQDGMTKSIDNEKVFRCIDPSNDACDFFGNHYTIGDIIDFKVVLRDLALFTTDNC